MAKEATEEEDDQDIEDDQEVFHRHIYMQLSFYFVYRGIYNPFMKEQTVSPAVAASIPSPLQPQPRLSRSESSERASLTTASQTSSQITAVDASRPVQRDVLSPDFLYRLDIEKRRYPILVNLPITVLRHPPDGSLMKPREVTHFSACVSVYSRLLTVSVDRQVVGRRTGGVNGSCTLRPAAELDCTS